VPHYICCAGRGKGTVRCPNATAPPFFPATSRGEKRKHKQRTLENALGFQLGWPRAIGPCQLGPNDINRERSCPTVPSPLDRNTPDPMREDCMNVRAIRNECVYTYECASGLQRMRLQPLAHLSGLQKNSPATVGSSSPHSESHGERHCAE
jgi:hypothetical protein